MQGVGISQATAEDWERVRGLRLRARRDAPDAFGTTYEEDAERSPSHWRQRVTGAGSAVLLATAQSVDVGLLCISPYDGHPNAACLSGMWVAPELRAEGIASTLLDAALEWARSAEYERVLLHVEDTNQIAAHIYTKRGFRQIGPATPSPPPRVHILEHLRELLL